MSVYRETCPVEKNMSPGDILRLAQEISGRHCTLLGVDQPYLDKKGLFWAIIRNRLAVRQLPRAGQTLHLQTWPMATSRTAYPRAVAAYDDGGDLVFACHSLWILMDAESRSMMLPGRSGVEVMGTDLPCPVAAPKSLSPVAQTRSFLRTVGPEDIDINRHMNNARYLDWVAELIPADAVLTEANLCYLNESREGQVLQVCCGEITDHTLTVELRREKAQGDFDRIFAAQLEFNRVVL